MNSAARVTKPPKPPAIEESRLWEFTLADYHRMCEVGILGEDDRCEFINGQVLKVMPPNPPHSKVTQRLMRALVPLFPANDWFVRIQDPVTLTDDEPQPDVSVALGPDDRYDARHPGPRDLVLLVEVSDTSIRFDTATKLALYAGEKVPQYWIVNIPQRRVEVYTQPRGGRNPTYRTRTDYGPGDAVPVVINGTTHGTISVRDVLP
jgi:Uma2 family endonuclease